MELFSSLQSINWNLFFSFIKSWNKCCKLNESHSVKLWSRTKWYRLIYIPGLACTDLCCMCLFMSPFLWIWHHQALDRRNERMGGGVASRERRRATPACRSLWCQLPLSPICFGHAVRCEISDLVLLSTTNTTSRPEGEREMEHTWVIHKVPSAQPFDFLLQLHKHKLQVFIVTIVLADNLTTTFVVFQCNSR